MPSAMKFIIQNSEFKITSSAVTHRGERTMPITWRLRHSMPIELFEEMKVAAG